MEYENYRRFTANELPKEQQEQIRKMLQFELTTALINAVRENPPEIDLAEVDLILKPEEQIRDFGEVANCGTCGTCVTCVTCVTA